MVPDIYKTDNSGAIEEIMDLNSFKGNHFRHLETHETQPMNIIHI